MRLAIAAAFLAAGCGSASSPGGVALAKFCNFLTVDGQDATVDVEVGPARFGAVTGTCTSAVNAPCTAIPAGSNPVRVLHGATLLGSLTSDFDENREYVLGVRASEDDPPRLVLERVLLEGVRCAEIDPALLVLTGKL